MDLVRPLVLQCMRLNTTIKAKHIPGVKNIIADAISRFNTQIFRLNAPAAERLPTEKTGRQENYEESLGTKDTPDVRGGEEKL